MITQLLLQNVFYFIVALMAVVLFVNMWKKRPAHELIAIALVLVVFTLRALHIK